jgi:hypothetical protein
MAIVVKAVCNDQPVISSLMRDFLTWIASGPRGYADVMDAWRTTCPRLAIWEDALAADYVRVEARPGEPAASNRVILTARGRAALGLASPG